MAPIGGARKQDQKSLLYGYEEKKIFAASFRIGWTVVGYEPLKAGRSSRVRGLSSGRRLSVPALHEWPGNPGHDQDAAGREAEGHRRGRGAGTMRFSRSSACFRTRRTTTKLPGTAAP